MCACFHCRLLAFEVEVVLSAVVAFVPAIAAAEAGIVVSSAVVVAVPEAVAEI